MDIKKILNNLLIIKDFFSDPGAIQTHDLQNRNLTLYSLSYGALMRGQKYKKSRHIPNHLSFFAANTSEQECYFESYYRLTRDKLLTNSANFDANINIIPIFAGQKHSIHL